MRSKAGQAPRPTTATASPWSMSFADWLQGMRRAWARSSADNVGLIAAGVAFYCFTAIVPTLASIVLSYGLLADAETVSRHIEGLFGMLPEQAATIVSDQLVDVVSTSSGQQGLGLLIALAIALYGVTKATSSMITALNIAYGETETRSLVRRTILSLLVVVGGVAMSLTALVVTASLAFLSSLIPEAPGFVLSGIRIGSYLLLAGLVLAAAASLYRYAPCRPNAKWVWVSPGAVVATAAWLTATAGFGFYASNFGNYNATYGSLGAVVVLLTWLWLSAFVFLFGAQLNGEMERRTSQPVLEKAGPPPTGAPETLPVASDGLGGQEGDPGGSTERPAPPSRTVPSNVRVGVRAEPVNPGAVGSTLQVKAGARAGGAGLSLPTAMLAGVGLARLRRGSPLGFVLLAGAIAIVWLSREKEAD